MQQLVSVLALRWPELPMGVTRQHSCKKNTMTSLQNSQHSSVIDICRNITQNTLLVPKAPSAVPYLRGNL